MSTFVLNGLVWHVLFVDPESRYLVDRTNTLRLATTDPVRRRVFLSSRLHGDMLTRVLLHELGHCVMFSYGLDADIHRVVPPSLWIEAEEWVCNFIADYGRTIFELAYNVLGDDAWIYLSVALDQAI